MQTVAILGQRQGSVNQHDLVQVRVTDGGALVVEGGVGGSGGGGVAEAMVPTRVTAPGAINMAAGAFSRAIRLVSGTATIGSYAMDVAAPISHTAQPGNTLAALTVTLGSSSVLEYIEAR